jgi:HEPN domain-containing protein
MQRETVDGWIDKAFNHLQTAREHSKSGYRYSEAVQAAQEYIEL